MHKIRNSKLEGIKSDMVFTISFSPDSFYIVTHPNYIATLKWILSPISQSPLKFPPMKNMEILEATTAVFKLSPIPPSMISPPIWKLEDVGATVTALLPKCQ